MVSVPLTLSVYPKASVLTAENAHPVRQQLSTLVGQDLCLTDALSCCFSTLILLRGYPAGDLIGEPEAVCQPLCCFQGQIVFDRMGAIPPEPRSR